MARAPSLFVIKEKVSAKGRREVRPSRRRVPRSKLVRSRDEAQFVVECTVCILARRVFHKCIRVLRSQRGLRNHYVTSEFFQC